MTTSFVQGKPPAGAARGGDGEHGNEQRAVRAARSQCSGVGAGEVKRRPQADLPSGGVAGRSKAAKEEHGLPRTG
ncbi:hypothetical protein [Xenorhabdus bovienii]|uniref:hypothetical protein n=1 Tax=Xenorhabdus bovienii TaxID=40576 RepID=UPI0023B2AF87|nr:hypothetical protein [Xenorhabdus bovienii]MDE9553150.1 hypothetical protein [Xenorhabdus bovienii]MDE9553157.1 hypothetical protein [Xenorhabdus bovienii]